MDDIKQFDYKIKGYDDISEEKRLTLLEKIKEIGGVLDAKFDDGEKSLTYIVNAKASDYEIFSALMELLDGEEVELVFEDEQIKEEKSEEESADLAESDDKTDDERNSVKEKKYEKVENIVVLSLSAVLIVLGFIFEKLVFNAARWVYMFGYAFAGYETLYSMISDIAEKRYAGEKIITLVSSFILLFMGNGLLGSVILFGFSLISCLYSMFGNFTERLKTVGESDDKIKETVGENDYFKKKKNFIYDIVIVAIGLAAIFLLPLTQINQYWSALTQKWLNIGIVFIILAMVGFKTKSVAADYVFARYNAANSGVKIADNAAMDKLAETTSVCFDKTGVLTANVGNVVKVEGEKNKIGSIIAFAEKDLTTPIAKVLSEYFTGFEPLSAKNRQYVEGRGVSFEYDGKKYYVGSKKFLNKNDVKIDNEGEYSAVYIAENSNVLGIVYIDFAVKNDASGVILELKEDLGIDSEILSSDSVKAVEKVRKSIGAANAVAGASAEYKAEHAGKDGVVYVGNAEGDKAVIEKLTNSIALGKSPNGQYVVSVENNDIKAVPYLIKLAKRMKKITNQNKIIWFAFKALSLTLCVMLSLLLKYNYAFFWAIFGGTLGELIVFLNSCRNLTEAV